MDRITSQSVTQWLHKWRDGDSEALAELTDVVYRDLRHLAQSYLNRERPDHTLQATALVHEAYLKIQDLQHFDWKNRAQFVAVLAQIMRHILVDHARQHLAHKRGGGAAKLPLNRAERIASQSGVDILDLHEALEKLGQESPRKAKVVELHYFGGLSAAEISQVLTENGTAVSQRTVENDLKIARARLHNSLSSPKPSEE